MTVDDIIAIIGLIASIYYLIFWIIPDKPMCPGEIDLYIYKKNHLNSGEYR